MLIEGDFKQMEILCAAYLSKDEVMYHELRTGADIHARNQQTLGLPTRLVAKTFIFRILFGGSAYAFAFDPEFKSVSSDVRFWQNIIDRFYDKYRGLYKWHNRIVQEVIRTGKLTIPTGRVYTYEKDEYGNWPRTTILNYPVQGFGADLMAIARVSLYRRLRRSNSPALLISTVHDSIILDCPNYHVPETVQIINSVWADIPRNFQKIFLSKLDLDTKVEIKVGKTWGTMSEYKVKEYLLQTALA